MNEIKFQQNETSLFTIINVSYRPLSLTQSIQPNQTSFSHFHAWLLHSFNFLKTEILKLKLKR